MPKPVILSGIKPTGRFNIGHYIGAMANWRKMMETYDAVFLIVDLHALTISPEPSEYSLSTPWSVWKEDENVVRLRFSRADPPALRLPGSKDTRPLAAAFDWVRIRPRPGVRDR